MKIIGTLLLFIVIAVAVKVIYPKLSSSSSGGNEKYPPPPGVAEGSRDHLKFIAGEIKKELPRKIDSETELTDVYAREGEFVYTGKLLNYSSKQIDGNKFRELAQTHLRKTICADRDVQRMWKKHDITLSFQFLGKDNFSLGMLSVSRGDC